MKNSYKVILMALAVLGIVYATAKPNWKKTQETDETKETKCEQDDLDKFPETLEEEVQYKSIDICTFPLSMEVGHYVQLKECHKRKIKLVQVDCISIGRDGGDFPCYKGSEVIEVKANFPAIFSASLNKNSGDEDKLKNVNLYWENGVNTIQGCAGWEELKLCLEVWSVDLHKTAVGTVEVGEITIGVRPPDDTQSED